MISTEPSVYNILIQIKCNYTRSQFWENSGSIDLHNSPGLNTINFYWMLSPFHNRIFHTCKLFVKRLKVTNNLFKSQSLVLHGIFNLTASLSTYIRKYRLCICKHTELETRFQYTSFPQTISLCIDHPDKQTKDYLPNGWTQNWQTVWMTALSPDHWLSALFGLLILPSNALNENSETEIQAPKIRCSIRPATESS